ncbi:MAG TPA: hypothetical protein VLZ81_01175, partial [Blastocatellia bacterium]|nr:hypothetical protein [Blastocatellia bacterium]
SEYELSDSRQEKTLSRFGTRHFVAHLVLDYRSSQTSATALAALVCVVPLHILETGVYWVAWG